MIVRVLLLAAAIFIILNAIGNFRRQEASERPKLLRRYALYTLIALTVLLAATGRLHWIGAAIAVLVPFASKFLALAWRVLPFVRFLRQQKAKPSVFQTSHIRLVVDPKSGQLQGEFLSGDFANQPLESLNEEQLRQQLQLWQSGEAESARLLTAYLQQRFASDNQAASNSDSGSNVASREEALEILGLEDGAEEKDIVTAHRALMQKLHPDRGGSNYLAAKVNQAKDFLLKT